MFNNQTFFLLNILNSNEKDLPQEFKLFTYGSNPAYKAGIGDFVIDFDEMAAYRIMVNNSGKDVMIDYDHGSLMDNPIDPSAAGKAAGFGKLKVKDEGLFLTDIKWTPAAAQALKNGEWQYVSPALEPPDANGLYKLMNVAITNMPALKNNAALMMNNRSKSMDDKELKELEELRAELAAARLNQKQMSAALEEANKAKEEQEAHDLIDQAIAEGKIGKADKAELLQFAATNKNSALRLMISKLNAKLPTSRTLAPVQKSNKPASVEGEEAELSAGVETVIMALSMKGSDGVGALIKTDEDKVKFLNKLNNKKTVEKAKRFADMLFGKGE